MYYRNHTYFCPYIFSLKGENKMLSLIKNFSILTLYVDPVVGFISKVRLSSVLRWFVSLLFEKKVSNGFDNTV